MHTTVGSVLGVGWWGRVSGDGFLEALCGLVEVEGGRCDVSEMGCAVVWFGRRRAECRFAATTASSGPAQCVSICAVEPRSHPSRGSRLRSLASCLDPLGVRS